MEKNFEYKNKWRILFLVMAIVGLATIVFAMINQSSRAWTNILLNNYLFVMLSVGALFFYSVQYVTHSGWSALFQRIPLALGAYLPVGAILMLVMYFGTHDVYEWSHADEVAGDPLLLHKSPWLNVPFFFIRVVLYFVLWIGLALWLLKLANREQNEGTLHVDKHDTASRVFIFAIVFTFPIASIDWIKSIDAHWFSTMFGLKNFLATIYYAVAFMCLVLLWLQKQGYFTQMTEAHRHDFARYLFRLSIVWGYLWFIQYLVIWYANIPETTVYYFPRINGEWSNLFYLDFFLNFAIPFLVLMNDKVARHKVVMIIISLMLLVGLWISLYLQIMPGSVHEIRFGLVEILSFIGFLGIFLLLVFYMLKKYSLVPVNHAYLEESKHRHL